MLVQLGSIQFNTNFGYDTLDNVKRWIWEEVGVINDHPALQFAGKSAELSFSGTYFNYAKSGDAPKAVEDLAEKTEPLGLTDDLGNFYGFWVITELSRAESFFRPEQKTGIQTQWNLRLRYYGINKER